VKGCSIGLVLNLTIATANSLATFLPAFFGEAIQTYLPLPASNFLVGLLFVCLGLQGLLADNHGGSEEVVCQEGPIGGQNPLARPPTHVGVIEGGMCA